MLDMLMHNRMDGEGLTYLSVINIITVYEAGG